MKLLCNELDFRLRNNSGKLVVYFWQHFQYFQRLGSKHSIETNVWYCKDLVSQFYSGEQTLAWQIFIKFVSLFIRKLYKTQHTMTKLWMLCVSKLIWVWNIWKLRCQHSKYFLNNTPRSWCAINKYFTYWGS